MRPLGGMAGCDQSRPSSAEQAGQAPQPCAAWTFSAIAICCSRLARLAVGA